jgi:hypothetical protein
MMRIDTSTSTSSMLMLGLDVPYRYAYRHLHVAIKAHGVGFFERMAHVIMSASLLIPAVGLIVAIAERILFPPNKGKANQQQSSEEAAKRLNTPPPVQQQEKKPINSQLLFDLVDNNLSVEKLTMDELEQLADQGKLWTLLSNSSKMVAQTFTAEHFKVLLENAHIATIQNRCETVASIVELIPFNKPSQLEILAVVCRYATPEMELVLQVKINQVRRLINSWGIDGDTISQLNTSMKHSFAQIKKLRDEQELQKEKKQQESEKRTYQFHVPLPGDSAPQIPINHGALRSEELLMSDQEFTEILNAELKNAEMFQQKDFLFKFLESYQECKLKEKSLFEDFMSKGLESQLTTLSIMQETVNMLPKEITGLVHLLHAVDPSRILLLWDQVLKNKAAFLGDQGKLMNSQRVGAAFGALSDEQMDHSLKDKKFEIVLKGYAKEAAQYLSPKHLDFASEVVGPDALSELIPALDEKDPVSLYEILKGVCKKFPDHIRAHQEKLTDFDLSLKNTNIEQNKQRFIQLKTKVDELKNQLITLERVLRVKIKKVNDLTKSQELLVLAGLSS